jgi:hypothetical protein
VPGVYKRRAVFSSQPAPLTSDGNDRAGCRAELWLRDAAPGGQALIVHGSLTPLMATQQLNLAGGLHGQKLSRALSRAGHYDQREVYVPYRDGFVALVSWATGQDAVEQCSAARAGLLSRLTWRPPTRRGAQQCFRTS